MFSIVINADGTDVRKYSVKRIKGKPGKLCEYLLGDGTIIKHYYDDGAEVLASKILNHYIIHHYEDICTSNISGVKKSEIAKREVKIKVKLTNQTHDQSNHLKKKKNTPITK